MFVVITPGLMGVPTWLDRTLERFATNLHRSP